MAEPLRLLLVEDSEDDALLLVRHLSREGWAPEVHRVETPEALAEALEHGPWDAAILDYALPRFTGLAAVRQIREAGLDLPVMVISGTVGEAVAVETMRAGAADYLMKDNLQRLGPALRRELRDAAERAGRRQAEAALTATRARLRVLLEASPVVLYAAEARAPFAATYVSANAARVLGINPHEVVGRPGAFRDRVHADDVAARDAAVGKAVAEGAAWAEYRLRTDAGVYRWVRDAMRRRPGPKGGAAEIAGVLVDVTDQREAWAEIESLARFPWENPHPVVRVAADGTLTHANPAAGGLLEAWETRVGEAAPPQWRALVTAVLRPGAARCGRSRSAGGRWPWRSRPSSDTPTCTATT